MKNILFSVSLFIPQFVLAQFYIPPTDLHSAVEAKDHAAVQRLVRKGVDVNEKDSEGKTPLHIACDFPRDNLSNIRYLIKHGAKTDLTDKEGKIPLEYWTSLLPPPEILLKMSPLNIAQRYKELYRESGAKLPQSTSSSVTKSCQNTF